MHIKRREFLRAAGSIAAITGVVPSMAFAGIKGMPGEEIQSFLLKGFEDEQEEYPSLVGNEKGETWMFSLRRLKYPQDKEVVSAFRLNGDSWIETEPVSRKEGQYEAPIAACAKGGNPVVAWSSIESDRWIINVSHFDGNGFPKPKQFKSKSGKPINPVLHAPAAGRTWIAWENYYEGKFTLMISKFEKGNWSDPIKIAKGENSCFDPALAEDKDGNLFVAYGLTDGYHQNIEMTLIDGHSLHVKKTIPIAIGGGFENRVNLNTKPALSFDSNDRLWISYENNRHATRLEDSDCYTGDRYCAMLSYQDGKIVEPVSGRWLFSGKNDHRPSFFHDRNGKLFVASHCGGDFVGNPYWQYRISWLDEEKGWVEPETIIKSKQKGVMIPPALAFDGKNRLWLSTLNEETFKYDEPIGNEQVVISRVTQLMAYQIPLPQAKLANETLQFKETVVEEFHPNSDFVPEISGHPRISGEQMEQDGEVYSLIYGNLHEHSENSPCWSAGTDGTLHEDYRFGLFSENYNFVGITDHGYSLNELYWRKNLRLADFYNDPPYFVALPSMEWTLTAKGDLESVFGAGHYNIIFASTQEARKFIRNSQEVYNVNSPESSNSRLLWELLHEKQINCITIPHHPADEAHPVDWNVHDEYYVPVVELFQCRGNGEYPGAPREINLERHSTTTSRRAFVDYALREKKYKMGFVASGDHNGMGVGVAALWVKDFSREGILEAMRSRRCFATTGDKMIVDFRINSSESPSLSIKVKGQRELERVEVLRNSRVIKEYHVSGEELEFDEVFVDADYQDEKDVLYYYVRATQKNKEIAWSSPVWVEQVKS